MERSRNVSVLFETGSTSVTTDALHSARAHQVVREQRYDEHSIALPRTVVTADQPPTNPCGRLGRLLWQRQRVELGDALRGSNKG
jgi:hypothetical protein